MEGTAALCSWAFENWPLRWLYAHCLPQNLRQFESTVRRGSMMHLGVLRERMVIDGELTDIHVLGMEREQWFAGSLHRGFARQRRADHPA
jgi:RimJ/RimL family protein N-acetyltransferase